MQGEGSPDQYRQSASSTRKRHPEQLPVLAFPRPPLCLTQPQPELLSLRFAFPSSRAALWAGVYSVLFSILPKKRPRHPCWWEEVWFSHLLLFPRLFPTCWEVSAPLLKPQPRAPSAALCLGPPGIIIHLVPLPDPAGAGGREGKHSAGASQEEARRADNSVWLPRGSEIPSHPICCAARETPLQHLQAVPEGQSRGWGEQQLLLPTASVCSQSHRRSCHLAGATSCIHRAAPAAPWMLL